MSYSRKYIREARERRQLRQTERGRVSERVPLPSYYEGHDGVTGRPIGRVAGGVGVPLEQLSNAQADIGQQGRVIAGGIDVGSRSLRVDRGKVPTVDIKILATCVFDGRRRLYLGGDRASTREIFNVDVSEQIGQVGFQNKGPGANEWTLGLSTLDSGGNYRIYTVFGDGTATWSITDAKTQPLVYYGEGFWSGFLGSPDAFKDERYETEQFMDYQGTQVKAFVTTPDGPGAATAVTTDSGIVQDPGPWVYTGTKTRVYRTDATRFLAPNNYTLQGIDNQERERIIETQCPTYRAYAGVLTYEPGAYRYRAFNRQQALYNRDPISPGLYPTYYLPSLPDLPNGESQQALSIDTTIAIAPTLNKPITLEYPGATGPNVGRFGDLEQYVPIAVFGDKTIYRSILGLGRHLYDSNLATFKYIYAASGGETELAFPQGLPQTFRDAVPYPTTRSVDIGGNLQDEALSSRLTCAINTLTPSVPIYDFTLSRSKSVRAFRVDLPSTADALVLGVY